MKAFLPILACFLAGCLSNVHRIPKGELIRLSQTAPAERGRSVRVVQSFEGDDAPPAAPEVHAGVGIVIVPGGPSGGGGSRGVPSAKLAKQEGKFWLIVAAAAAVGFAVSEGSRYDGWVELHPMYPVHIYGPYGEYSWVPLAQLDPQTAMWASKAFVREGEGPWRRLGRAPLNRQGFSYSVLMGSSKFPASDGSEQRGFMSHIQLGAFPIHQLGIMLDLGFGWGKSQTHYDVVDSRWALELQFLPLSAGIFHAGAFGQLGFGRRLDDGPGTRDRSDQFWGAGALIQLELTTRLAITARAAVTDIYDERIDDFTVGLSIY